MEKGLRVENVRKKIGDFTLSADFTVGPGECAALLGRSGSGKTSLLRIIAGFENLNLPECSGKIFLDGKEITNLPPEKREIGMVFQEQILFPALNVLENASFGLKMRGVGKEERHELVLHFLEKFGMRKLAHSQVDTLSGGEKQRVAFIRAIVWKPKLILLDEPFSALDMQIRAVLRKELLELHALWPVPLILVTHDQTDVDMIATKKMSIGENKNGKTYSFY